MKYYVLTVLFYGLVFKGFSDAHIGDMIYPIYEITDEDLLLFDFDDNSIAEWKDILGAPSLVLKDFRSLQLSHSTEEEHRISMDPLIWLGWNQTLNRIYLAIECADDGYINEYEGGNLTEVWQYDSIEFIIDGDHSGGEYGFRPDCCETEEEWMLLDNNQAQNYFAIAETPDRHHIGYLGAGAEWVNSSPYSDGNGFTWDQSEENNRNWQIEFYITPFDNLVWNNPDVSKVSSLYPEKIIGFNVIVFDYDTAPRVHSNIASTDLSGEAATWRYAERLVDGILIGANQSSTKIGNISWARIKASFR